MKTKYTSHKNLHIFFLPSNISTHPHYRTTIHSTHSTQRRTQVPYPFSSPVREQHRQIHPQHLATAYSQPGETCKRPHLHKPRRQELREKEEEEEEEEEEGKKRGTERVVTGPKS